MLIVKTFEELLPVLQRNRNLDWALRVKGIACLWEAARSASMAGSEEDPGGCGQGSGMDQFCFLPATGSDLVRFMVSSAWHYLSPLESLHMLCSLFPRSRLLGAWESVCWKTWWNQCLFWFCVGHSIWPCCKENPMTCGIFGSSYTGV